jgi:glyoxylase-like metal-dependent hydrolase (beta-lactamase superfamily II)
MGIRIRCSEGRADDLHPLRAQHRVEWAAELRVPVADEEPDGARASVEVCPVYLHATELPLANGDLAAITKYAGPLDHWVILPLMRAMGRRRREAMLAASSLRDFSRPLEPDAGIPGLPGWECIPTPGHTPGHVSFFRSRDRVLITGDALVTLELNSLTGLLLQRHGLSGPPWYTTWSWRAAKESVATLARLEPNVLACGHGTHLAGPGTADAVRAFAGRSGDATPIR